MLVGGLRWLAVWVCQKLERQPGDGGHTVSCFPVLVGWEGLDCFEALHLSIAVVLIAMHDPIAMSR